MSTVPVIYGIDVQSLRKMIGESMRFAGLCCDSPAVIASCRTACIRLSDYRDFYVCNDGFSVQRQTKWATPGQILNREFTRIPGVLGSAVLPKDGQQPEGGCCKSS